MQVGFGEVLGDLLAAQKWEAPLRVVDKRSRRLFQDVPRENFATCGPFVGWGWGGRTWRCREAELGAKRQRFGSILDQQTCFGFFEVCSSQVAYRAADAAQKGR